MNYELARQLYEANFPKEIRLLTDNDQIWEAKDTPTLSELIEACEPRITAFEKDEQDGNLWCAYECTETDYFEGRGKTPEEAVAKLWLALRKRKT
jgi:hypothetical protein